jgi:hypothetical protein
VEAKGMRGRTFLTLAAILCMLPQADPSRTLQRKQNPAQASIRLSKHPAPVVTVPFEYYKQHIYVPISLQGKPGFVFMLDSGANRDILNLRTSKQLGMQPSNMKSEGKVGFGYDLIYVAPAEQMDADLGGLRAASTMSVMDLNRFEMHFSHPTDGMLGYPFFQRYVVKLDFQKKALTLFAPEDFRYRGLGMKIALAHAPDRVVLPVTIGSDGHQQHSRDVIVDTGSNVGLLLYENFLSSLGLQNNLAYAQPGQAFGLNGYYPVKRGIVYSLLIGQAETRNLPVDYLEKDDQNSAATRPGAIGNGILQCFQVVIFDLPHHRMIFEMKPQPLQSGLVRTSSVP